MKKIKEILKIIARKLRKSFRKMNGEERLLTIVGFNISMLAAVLFSHIFKLLGTWAFILFWITVIGSLGVWFYFWIEDEMNKNEEE